MKFNKESSIRTMVKNADPVDIYVGGRIRMRRTLLGMSQEKLGNKLGITFQQVQKYENGANRVGSSRLFAICKILGVPVSYFFDGYEDVSNVNSSVAEESAKLDATINSRESIELLKAYYSIEDKIVRKKIYQMIKSLVGDNNSDDEDASNKQS